MYLANEHVKYNVGRIFARSLKHIQTIFESKSGFLDLKDFWTSVPVSFDFESLSEEQFEIVKNKKTYFELLGGYIKRQRKENEIIMKVNIIFRIPENEELQNEWLEMMTSPGNRGYRDSRTDFSSVDAIIFIYMHEIMHVMLKHWALSFNINLDEIIKKYYPDPELLSPDVIHKYKNFATDFYINALLLENSSEKSRWYQAATSRGYRQSTPSNSEELPFLYHPDLSPSKNETVETILIKLLENAEVESFNIDGDESSDNTGDDGSEGDGNGSNAGNSGSGGSGNGDTKGKQQRESSNKWVKHTIKYKGIESSLLEYKGDPEALDKLMNGEGKASAKVKEELSEAMGSAINGIVSKTRGLGSAEIMQKLGMPIKVTVDWLQLIKSNMSKITKKYARRSTINWAKLKSKYRHIAHLPSVVYIENTLEAVVSIDQSGSMSDVELLKINYILEKLASRCRRVHLIVHDSEIVLYKDIKRKVEDELTKIIGKRYSCGGTSHSEVFDKIDEIYQKTKDIIYISFSDNYSDIESEICSRSWKNSIYLYWVCTNTEESGGSRWLDHSVVPGMQVDFDGTMYRKF